MEDLEEKLGYSITVPDIEWKKRKREYTARIVEDRDIGYLDPGIEPYLEAINSRPDSYTTSSCIGRVSIIDAPAPWAKREGSVVFKKHGEITVGELETVLKTRPKHTYWIVASGPIIHVMTRSLQEALYILGKAREAGFKHSGITSASNKGFLVEIISSTQLILPIKRGDSRIPGDGGSLDILVETINETVREGRRRLDKFMEALGK